MTSRRDRLTWRSSHPDMSTSLDSMQCREAAEELKGASSAGTIDPRVAGALRFRSRNRSSRARTGFPHPCRTNIRRWSTASPSSFASLPDTHTRRTALREELAGPPWVIPRMPLPVRPGVARTAPDRRPDTTIPPVDRALCPRARRCRLGQGSVPNRLPLPRHRRRRRRNHWKASRSRNSSSFRTCSRLRWVAWGPPALNHVSRSFPNFDLGFESRGHFPYALPHFVSWSRHFVSFRPERTQYWHRRRRKARP
jgi:hypothetical protein